MHKPTDPTREGSGAPASTIEAAATTGHARNVLANWAGSMVFVASGFVVPRFIDGHMGPELLGIWDLGWSLVAYVSLLSLGIASAVNRYVSRHRATGTWSDLNRTTNSCLAVLLAAGGVGLVLTVAFVVAVPWLISESAAGLQATAQWVILALGFSAALQLPASVFNGVITGCERFDLKNIIRSGCHLLTVVGLILLLISGGGLVALAVVVLAGQILAAVLQFVCARRVCPGFAIDLRTVRWATVKEVSTFGGKTVLQSMSRVILQQTVSVLVVVMLGPMALAVYARQRSLVDHATRFLNQYAHVFIPASSALHARDDREGLKTLLFTTGRYALYICLPLVAFLAVMGGPLVHLWMGDSYAAPLVIAILTIGHLGSMSQRGAFAILMGMGMHGRSALWELIGAITGVLLCLIFMGFFDWGLVGAAVGVAIPLSIVGGAAPALFACRALDVRLGTYLRAVSAGPLLCVIPFVLCLASARWIYADEPLTALLFGGVAGGAVLGAIYYRFVLPATLRAKCISILRKPVQWKRPAMVGD